ncbi:MAG: protein kinase [Thermoanaerobaculia bacterium]|nr:protein kinase [Thermoanaerobaculia bacterium]
MSLAPGQRLGPYEIVAALGAGGMGEVFRARDVRLGREVAVKLLHAALAGEPARRARFEREARAVGSLNHPNLLTLFDVGEHDGASFLVTELLDGETLRDRLARGPLERGRALELAAGIARGLAAAHAQGVVHRDLKPENLFVTRDGRAKILDFGLARVDGAASADGPTLAEEHLTLEGALVGTPAYMAPEQVRGLPVDHRADLFAFGVVLFEMLLGRRPFAGASVPELLAAILHSTPAELAEDGPLPADVRRLLQRCLARDPARRASSAHDLALELEELATATTSSATTSSTAATPAELRAPTTLAVLPFTNRTGDAGAEFLSDGLAEQILNSLARLPDLKVLARATCFRFRDRAGEPVEVGRELGAGAVVTGRVFQVSGRLVVQSELTDVGEGVQLWGEQYDRRTDDLLAVQLEIGREVAQALGHRLAPGRPGRAERPLTENPRAYELHLRGRHFLNRRTIDAMRKAVELLQAAVEADPRYALAWSGLADAWSLLARYGGEPPRDVMPRAREAALRALEESDDLAEPHVSLGQVLWYYEWDLPAAVQEFQRAIAINPNYAQAHHWLAFDLAEVGRIDEAEAAMARALEIDPLSLIIRTNAGTVAYFARRFELAVERCDRALELDAAFAVGHQWRGRSLEALGRRDEAIAAFRAAELQLGDEPETMASLGHALARAGRRDEAEAIASRLEAMSASRYVSPYWRAVLQAGLDHRDAALDLLTSAIDARADWVVALPVEPIFDEFRELPRFRDLLARIRPRTRTR